MLRPDRLEWRVSPRVLAGFVSVVLHLGLFLLLVLSGGRLDGIDDAETPVTRVVLFESRKADHSEGIDLPPLQPTIPTVELHEQLKVENIPPPSLPPHELITQPAAPAEPGETVAVPPVDLAAVPPVTIDAVDLPATLVLPQAQQAAMMQHLTQLAEELAKTPQAQVAWEQDGKQYQATLVLERARNGVEFDRVFADVSAEDRGRQFTTRVRFKRLAFSHYTQIIDRWDPMVQLHDDEVTGRFHVNSQFNLLYDRQTAPTFFGKVTTAAGSFNMQSAGKRREADIFRAGVETRAGRIAMPERPQPFEWAPREQNVRVHEFSNDTRIRFFADGSYMWRGRDADTAEYRNEPCGPPVYFIATGAVTLYVQGIVCGQALIYSPHRIVVEGNLTYAHDPRGSPDSGDYLGLVSDRYVEVAGPHVTGPGDIDIHAAIFAGRRFVVRDIDHRRSATLRIYGSLAAGSVSATEPRYATKIEYDGRFEQQRPPGFPSTNRFAAEDWDGLWTEQSEPDP